MSARINPIPSSLAAESERRWQRLCAAIEPPQTAPDPSIEALVRRAFAISRFVADIAATEPRWFLDNVAANSTRARTLDDYREQLAAIANDDDPETVFRGFRQLRNREFARIAWRDFILDVAVPVITAELSAFADACIQIGLGWCERQCAARYGQPRDANGDVITMNVLGMGKLGGNELNFSSDIDLVFAFSSAGNTAGGRRELSNQEYFDKLGRALIALLSEPTADGFVFRVDMRLRPFGDSGPLTSNFGALEHYYQLHGRDWERYAFIKARIVAGNEQTSARLEKILKPFVYRRYLDYGALEAVREMKALIDTEVARRELDMHVKLGPGGIREIEFIGQTFQMIRGGQEPRLQNRSILEILNVCVTLKLLDAQDAAGLSSAYLFLRQTEHRLQQFADQQTHEIPYYPIERERLAYSLGFSDYAQFEARLEQHRDVVRRCFDELLRPEQSDERDAEVSVTLAMARQVWIDGTNEDALRELGFDDPAAASTAIELLRAPKYLDRLSREGRERLNRLMPLLLETAGRRAQSVVTFNRLADLVRAIARRSVYLALLADHPATLARLVDLYSASPWIAQQITQQPALLDELLDARILFAPPDQGELVQLLGQKLRLHDLDDVEKVMNTIRNFKNQQVLRIAASDIMKQFPVAEVSNQLSYVAATLLHHGLLMAQANLLLKHGKPMCIDKGVPREVGFAIVAYGKLGGYELGYGSDLDLVFVHDGTGEQEFTDGERAIDNNVYFTRVCQRIIHFLSTRTSAGRAYEVDTRLRPSGDSGLLVSSIKAFALYQDNEAWTWEHQALIRARAVCGDPQTILDFENVRRTTLARAREPDRLRADILDMRERMRAELDRSDGEYFDLKQGPGGITDVEFMVQYGVLRWASEYPDLLTFSDNLRLLEVLTRLGLMSDSMGATLHDAYFAYRAEVHRCALQEIDGLVEETSFREHRAAVVAAWLEFFDLNDKST